MVVVPRTLRSALQMLVEVHGLQEEPCWERGKMSVSEWAPNGGVGTRDLILPGSQGARGTLVWLWVQQGLEQGSSVSPCFAGGS